MNAPEWTELHDQIARKLETLNTSFQKSVQEDLHKYGGYHESAAVLSFFELGKLRPSRSSVKENVKDLAADCFLIYDYLKNPRWTLLPQVRRNVIKQMGSSEALKQALLVNHERPNDSIQQMLEAYINNFPPDIKQLGTDNLTAICQILEWFEGTETLNNLPSFREVNNRLSFLRLIEPLQKLVGEHFSGREKQLQVIRKHVGVKISPADDAKISAGAPDDLNVQDKTPLMIYGPGGVGKSTLVAKYILEYIGTEFPFAYLDLDRRGLLPEEPATILVEIIRQLGIQFPDAQESLDRLRQNLQNDLTSAVRESQSKRYLTERYAFIWNDKSRKDHFLKNLDALFFSLNIKHKPFLLVLDTFEEVQLRNRQYISQLWDFLEEFQTIVPKLRIILSGRARLTDYPVKPLQISDFDAEAAEGFLLHRKVKPLALVREIVRRVGGSPMSLSLAAEVFEKEKSESKNFFENLMQNQIQAQLYTRILEHIKNAEVQKLAHPGLILRLITKEIILHVLAKPCGIKADNPEDAERLFNELAEDLTLVIPEGKETLRHNPEIRRLMIRLLREDEKTKSRVKEIQNSVIAYYENFTEPEFRAEEIYHRLALKQDHKLIESRWIDGIEPYLYNAIEELEPAEQAFLASRLNIQLDDKILALSTQEDWEKIIGARVSVLLEQNKAEEALQALNQRSDRLPASNLYLLEAKAYELQGLHDKTLKLALEVLNKIPFDNLLSFEMLILEAKTFLRRRKFPRAGKCMQMARESALAQNNEYRFFETTLELLGLKEHLPNLNLEKIWFSSLAKELVLKIVKEQRIEENVLLLKIVGVYGKDDQEILLQAITFSGFEGANQSLLRDLARCISDWDLEYSSSYDDSGFLTRAAGIPFHGDIFDAWLTLMAKESPTVIRHNITYLLSHFEAPEPVRNVLVTMFHRPLWSESIIQETNKTGIQTEELKTKYRSSEHVTDSEKTSPKSKSLTSAQLSSIHDAMLDAFPNLESLRAMLYLRLSLDIDAIAPVSASLSDIVLQVILYAENTALLSKLISAAIESNPSNIKLRDIAQKIGVVSETASDISRLEPIIQSSGKFIPIAQWRSNLSVIEGQVCRVEINSKSYGTGFLIGSNLLMTSFHVIESVIEGVNMPSDVTFRFDYKELKKGVINAGNVFRLARENWLVAFSSYTETFNPLDKNLAELNFRPGLDFAILRLDGTPGQESIGGFLEANASLRGWIDLNIISDEAIENHIMIFHHPSAGPLKMGVGNTFTQEDKDHIIYNLQTEPGSGGAPCFDLNCRLLALHEGKVTSKKEKSAVGHGLLVSSILESLPVYIKEIVLRTDRIDSVLLQNGRILLNRKILRSALREMLSVEGKKILIINGPKGSGKSYTKEFVYHVTQDIPNTKISVVNLAQIETVKELTETISISLGEQTRDLPLPGAEQASLSLQELARFALTNISHNPSINRWLILDNFSLHLTANKQTTEFLSHLLIYAAANLQNLRIILIGFTGKFPPDVSEKVLVENIEPINRKDIEDFLEMYLKNRSISMPDFEIKKLVESFLDSAGNLSSNDYEEQRIRNLITSINKWINEH